MTAEDLPHIQNPPPVKLNRASLGSDKKSVTVSWNRAAGCNYYCVFRKTPSTGWKRLANVRDPYTVYTDRNPVKGQTNIYTVRGYYSPTKTYGNYNTRGLSVNVPKTGTPDKPQKVTPGPVTLSKISAPAYPIKSISSGKKPQMPPTTRSTIRNLPAVSG